MTPLRLLLASLAYYWRMNWAVGLGVVAGTAVLTGALVVGDSVRGSLRRLTLDRLGQVDEAVVANRFFRAELVAETEDAPGFGRVLERAVGTIMLEGSVADAESKSRAAGVTLIGSSEAFWRLGRGGPRRLPVAGEVVLNEPLASQLGVAAGDDVLVRLPQMSEIPADSPLGRKTETVGSRRLTVSEVIEAEGLGRFALRADQQVPLNAYVDLELLAEAAGAEGGVNAILAVRKGRGEEGGRAVLDGLVRPRLADVGLTVEKTDRGYFNVTSEGMLLEPAVERAVLEAVGDGGASDTGQRGTGQSEARKSRAGRGEAVQVQPVLTYLANYILAGKEGQAKIPYSTVAALDVRREAPLGPLETVEGGTVESIGEGEILLNSWAAEDLQDQGVAIAPGDAIELVFFEPESTHGNVREKRALLKLKGVVALEGAAADRELTPELKGVTDEESLADWNPPFPYDPERVRSRPPEDQDEQYWDDYRATPKAFVSLAEGRRLWGSRFGKTTSVRIAGAGMDRGELVERIESELADKAAEVGFSARAVKAEGLAASSGTTPFNMLFLGFSFFIIAAAVMLVALLFRLGMERRAQEMGLLMAVGWRAGQVGRLLMGEGVAVAAVAGVAGAAAGVGYAWLMLAGLRTPGWWLAAVSTPFLKLHVTWTSLVVGYASGVAVSGAAIGWSIWRMRKVSVRRLLTNQTEEVGPGGGRQGRAVAWSRAAAAVGLVGAVSTGVAGMWLTGEARAGAFFGSGALVLLSLLALVWSGLKAGEMGGLVRAGKWAIARLAARNGARNPGRSTLTIGLVAAASFLIVAISAFRLEPPEAIERLESGSGGFTILAESAQPIFHDLGSRDGRMELGFSEAESGALAEAGIFSLRMRPGDDASCLNLYQPMQPRVLGVSERFIERGGFAWQDSAATTEATRSNPWQLLKAGRGKAGNGGTVPVILDANTSQYSLHLGGVGDEFEIADGRGGVLRLEVVGLLKNSVLQGMLLISEEAFLEHFPQTSGYRFFLIEAPSQRVEATVKVLEEGLGDYGLDAVPSRQRLEALMAVQNTYLSTFQSLGGLGLLLGTVGLAVVQLRNVLERRGELALLRAAGFSKSLVARLVLLENWFLLAGGLGVGLLAALVAVLPHLFGGGAGIPWDWLAITLALVVGAGMAAGLAAVRAAVAAPIMPALRGE